MTYERIDSLRTSYLRARLAKVCNKGKRPFPARLVRVTTHLVSPGHPSSTRPISDAAKSPIETKHRFNLIRITVLLYTPGPIHTISA
jgi:hypothetical protein